MREPIPSLNKTYSILVQEENQSGLSGIVLVNTVDGNKSFSGNQKPLKRNWRKVMTYTTTSIVL